LYLPNQELAIDICDYVRNVYASRIYDRTHIEEIYYD